MAKLNIENFSALKDKTRHEIIEILGKNYHPESDEGILIYIIRKNWFNSKGEALLIEFNKEGKSDTVYTHNHYDFKK